MDSNEEQRNKCKTRVVCMSKNRKKVIYHKENVRNLPPQYNDCARAKKLKFNGFKVAL